MIRLLADFKMTSLVGQANRLGIVKKDIISIIPYKDQVYLLYNDTTKTE